jgi:hypothetical protein
MQSAAFVEAHNRLREAGRPPRRVLARRGSILDWLATGR